MTDEVPPDPVRMGGKRARGKSGRGRRAAADKASNAAADRMYAMGLTQARSAQQWTVDQIFDALRRWWPVQDWRNAPSKRIADEAAGIVDGLTEILVERGFVDLAPLLERISHDRGDRR